MPRLFHTAWHGLPGAGKAGQRGRCPPTRGKLATRADPTRAVSGRMPGWTRSRPRSSRPACGRVYETRRIVRSTDVAPSGRLRLDSVALYLQSAAEDDLADAGLAEPVVWLMRRCQLSISSLPAAGERLAIRTFCSGTGPRWAERTTTLCGADGEWSRRGPCGRSWARQTAG